MYVDPSVHVFENLFFALGLQMRSLMTRVSVREMGELIRKCRPASLGYCGYIVGKVRREFKLF
jgi:hypothetical protein